MRKRFYIYIAFVCLIILVAFKKPVKTDPFRKFKILSEVIRHAQEAYFKDLFQEIPDSENGQTLMDNALEGAIKGFLEELDPHSNYISSDDMKMVSESFEGNFEGNLQSCIFNDFGSITKSDNQDNIR